MTPENVTRYRVKTTRGYYFTESNGRYLRFYGTQKRGEIVCQKHAENLITFLAELDPEYNPEREDFMGNAPCAVCQRMERR